MKHAVRLALAFGLLLGTGAVSAADVSTPVGTWKQVDDVSGKPTSILQITESNGQLQAKVLQVMNASPEDVARDGNPPKCTQCDGARKDQPIIGMTIMWGVTRDYDVWDGGRILDPKNGKVYKVKLTLKDHGQKLDVHGYIGFSLLGRSQVWERTE
ncbi:DUF2147 domain-containing protein [Rhodanobacter sp. DHG33]|uniref:DUF2147 domain-containing protein n=1 Tax=Rhodanobacter sp. DHG33 TaxID=2775921 RepID=UPI00177F6AF9|nr:DUF2147 domain-containing protein [Rhodanobacter sp. DHG33]MBD8900295.1 DUF2147 domain-containing protein [Rhodanobacter sp. DHG33]